MRRRTRFTPDINYIPFYKTLDENSDVQAAATQSGLVNQYFSKALKGGAKPFGDLMENTLRNWSHILSAAMKNEAANATIKAAMKLDGAYPNLKVGLDWIDGKVYSSRTGEMVGDGSLKPEYTTSGKGTVKTVIDGKPAYFDVKEPLLLESILSIGYMGPQSKFLEVARGFKNMLQFGVTLSPAFKIRNLIREKKVYQIDLVIETSLQEGMITLNRSMVNFIKQKEISLESAELYSLNPAELRILLERS